MYTSPSSTTTAIRSLPAEIDTRRRPCSAWLQLSPMGVTVGEGALSQLVHTIAVPSRVSAPLKASPATM
jgi:hypothetical protein